MSARPRDTSLTTAEGNDGQLRTSRQLATSLPDRTASDIATVLAGLPDRRAAILDLCDVGPLDPTVARALRQALDEVSRRGVVIALAANEPDVRLPLIREKVHHRAPLCRNVSNARAALQRRLEELWSDGWTGGGG